jgi:hypothetical protein
MGNLIAERSLTLLNQPGLVAGRGRAGSRSLPAAGKREDP